jgi:hypothetical protein
MNETCVSQKKSVYINLTRDQGWIFKQWKTRVNSGGGGDFIRQFQFCQTLSYLQQQN